MGLERGAQFVALILGQWRTHDCVNPFCYAFTETAFPEGWDTLGSL
jgi:hypothetical protein